MPIPETQLETWARQGAVTTAKQTHEAIRRALTCETSLVQNVDADVYLQGSYRNDTNVRADSDVDVVVQLNSTFFGDLTALSPSERAAWDAAYPSATYQWMDFRRDVLKTLRSYFGQADIAEGKRSLKLKPGPGRLAADIVPCARHRRYEFFESTSLEGYVEGIKFWSLPDNQVIVNFPKRHYQNGVEKHSAVRTGGWFKPAVRMFKNARTRCVERKLLPPDAAPSYFVECFVYNASDSAFGPTYQSTYVQILDSLRRRLCSEFVCQNEQMPLFGTTPQQWSTDRASALLGALIELWNHW